ncbi:uncharacterized protein LOC141707977 isoform X2 [Apium graveolens]
MSKSYSDLGPSNHNTREEMSVTKTENSSSSTTPVKHPKGDDNSDIGCLARAPSLPSYMEPEVDIFHPVEEKKHDSGGSNWITPNNLIREQSLPSCFKGQEEDEDEETDFMLGRLIRRATLNSSSHVLPPRHNSKTQNSGFPAKYPPRKRTDQSKMDSRDQHLSDGAKIRRSSSDIQTKQVKSFKTLSSVQGNCRDKSKEKMTENHFPTIPNLCDNEKRSSQDMKAEIKFWARAVASNVAAPSLSIANRN